MSWENYYIHIINKSLSLLYKKIGIIPVPWWFLEGHKITLLYMWILFNCVTYLVSKFNDLPSAALENLTGLLQWLDVRNRDQAHQQLEEDPNCFSSLLSWTNLRKPGIEYVWVCCLKANQQVCWALCFSQTKASMVQLLAKNEIRQSNCTLYYLYLVNSTLVGCLAAA